MVISGRSVNLTTLFLGRLRPPKWLTSTPKWLTGTSSVTDNCHLESAEVETKYVAGPGIKPEPLALESDALSTALRGPAFGMELGATLNVLNSHLTPLPYVKMSFRVSIMKWVVIVCL